MDTMTPDHSSGSVTANNSISCSPSHIEVPTIQLRMLAEPMSVFFIYTDSEL